MKTLFASACLLLWTAAPLLAQTKADYQSAVTGQGPTHYFKLDGSLESAVNPSVLLQLFDSDGDAGFTADVYRNPSNCFYFVDNSDELSNTTEPLINGGGVSNIAATATGSITFLFRALDGLNAGGERWLFDARNLLSDAGISNHNALALWFERADDTNRTSPGTLKLQFGDSTTVLLETNDIVFGSWYYFALTYDEARDPNSGIWYLGPAGQQLKSGFTTNSPESVAGGGLGLFVGNRSTLNGAYRSPGNGRIDEFAIWARELSSTEVSNQFARLPQPPPPGATYRQIVQSQFPTYYFRLDNSLLESVGSNLLLSAAGSGGAFTNDFLGVADWAYSFSATNDALFVTNDLIPGGGPGQNTLATGKGSISFQFRMLSDTNNTGQRFIFSAPGSEATSTDDNMLALYLENSDTTNSFPGSLKLRVGNLTKGSTGSSTPENNVPIAFATNLVPNAWYYFAMTYDEARNTPEVYTYFGQAGGTLISDIANPANASVVGDNGWLVLGNKREISAIVDNAFRGPGSGVIDEFAIWQDELGPAEIQAQFAAMVAPVEPPTLGIALTGGNVVLSWTTEGTAGFELESTTSLSTPSWTGAGTPTVVEDMNYVTNSVAGNGTYYRLSKPKQ